MGFCQLCERFFPTSNAGQEQVWKAHVLHRCNNGLLKIIFKLEAKEFFEIDRDYKVVNTIPQLTGLPLGATLVAIKGCDLRKKDYDDFLKKTGKYAKNSVLEYTFQLKDSKIDYVNKTDIKVREKKFVDWS